MKESYVVGISTGPINNRLEKSTSFKELWLSSLLFSEISRELLEKIYFQDFFEVYSPRILEKKKLVDSSILNRFPDRIIFKAFGMSLPELEEKLSLMIEEIKITISDTKYNDISINYVILEGKASLTDVNNELLKNDDKKPMSNTINNCLTFTPKITDKFEEFINNICKEDQDILTKSNDSSKSTEDYLMVYYDGNNVGKGLELIFSENIDKYILASEALGEFSRNVCDMIRSENRYKIIPAYIVGDDGCFLIPTNVFYDNNHQLFYELLSKITTEYSETIGKFIPGTSLRFSVTIGNSKMSFNEIYKVTYAGLSKVKILVAEQTDSKKGIGTLIQGLNSDCNGEELLLNLPENYDLYRHDFKT